MDITPLIPKGRQVITGYGAGGFKINGEEAKGSLLVFTDRTAPWPVDSPIALTEENLAPIYQDGTIELLLIGTGAYYSPVPAALRASLKAHGIILEIMDTGAACRTYNLLLSEERRVAAALIAV